ncbi:glycosyltransferase family 39 protein [Simiduia sp. 21SJ11W-1]|uniref:glycosyltransferase family 39 protein n=1 Tax=Simiduia sp. 21SJ11W-1 TaxID=2909669 RepID=UPI0020A20226|nr:glycosyltransferase family 39 protein [Simiduia sp. 21SJ11W-1]UTA48061.1 glycosyltransferase family 39 protein [Simiduia sp. 21SJ11W-1]
MAGFSTHVHRVLLGAAALHLLLGALLPLTLFESHYALYGYYLQLSYVDHPPLMGWLQGLIQLVNSSDFALRLMPIALTLATQYTLVAIAQRLYPGEARIGVAVAWLVQLMPISHIVFAAAPDLPLALFACLAFWALLHLLEEDTWAAWLGLGACLGLAGLSKYTAICLVISLPIALWLGGRGARWLLSPKPWVAGALAVALVSPVVIWNYQHDWLSFHFQADYQEGDHDGWSGAALGQALATQLGVYSPFILLLFALRRDLAWRAHALCLSWALPALVLFALQAGSGRTSPHWTYLAWLALVPAAAYVLLHHWHRRWLRVASYVWGSLLGLVIAAVLALPFIPFEDYKHPLRKVIGWQSAALAAEQLRQQWANEQEPGYHTEPSLLVYNWHYAEPIAWYARPAPVRDVKAKQSQYSQWFGHFGPGDRGLMVRPHKSEVPKPVYLDNVECTPVDFHTATFRGRKAQTFHFYRCYWPVN